MTPDSELLERYARNGDDDAFAELVRRYVDLAYSAAVRVLRSDTHLAQDVCQGVFTDLAQKAGTLARHQTLVGWLHTSVRYAALDALRRERRRHHREQEASAMQDPRSSTEPSWDQLRPVLDEAVGALRARDRDAVLLRFFQDKSYPEIAAALGLNEEAARKRVDRALEKLRGHFSRRGVAVSAGLLAGALNANSVQAAPAGLAQNLSGAALAAGPASGGILAPLLAMTIKAKIALAATAIVAVSSSVYYLTQPIAPESAVTAVSPTTVPESKPNRPPAIPAITSPAVASAALQERPALPETSPQLEAVKQTLATIGIVDGIQNFDPQTIAIVQDWVRHDPEGVLAWLQTIPDERKQREHTLEALMHIEMETYPEAAFYLVSQMPEGTARSNRLNDVVRSWYPRDPAGTAKAIQEAKLTDEERNKLLQFVERQQAAAQRASAN